jgi:nucleoside 2-deoxyribosyltransferase
MKIYLSGPMTGSPDSNFPAFHEQAARLRKLGFDVVNPAEINPDASLSWEQCMRADIKALCDCDVIYLLPGWEGSKGAHLELHIAHRLGLDIKYG